MARKATPLPPTRAELTTDKMRRAIALFRQVIERLEQFEPSDIGDRDDPRIFELETAIRSAIDKIYPRGSTQHNQYINAASIDHAGYNMMEPTPIHEVREGLMLGKNQAIILLTSAVADLEEDLEAQGDLTSVTSAIQSDPRDDTNIFVVHGHDDAAKHEVARLIENTGLNPIILNEQASQGRTVIEKLEKYSDVGFAVVLLTPDDEGKSKNQTELRPRARQNVIAELFYFLGKLDRSCVCALKKGNLEIPSDIGGVVYIDLDPAGGWKVELLRELMTAGYAVDWDKALG